MKYRTVKVHALEDLGASGTKIIDINVKDPITQLVIPFKYNVPDNVARIGSEFDIISKLSIIDGSDVITELSGESLVASAFYEGHKVVNTAGGNQGGWAQKASLVIPFGRFFRDPLLAFDPTKFNNPQIKITYDAARICAGGTKFYFSLIAECFDEKIINPIGFLRTTLLHEYTGAATAYKYIDLPTDLVIRKLYIQCKQYDKSVAQNITDVKLSEDNDKRIVFDLEAYEWVNRLAAEFGECTQEFFIRTYGATRPCVLAPYSYARIGGVNQMHEESFNMPDTEVGWYSAAAAATDNIIHGGVAGLLPYAHLCYAFGDQQDIDDWYDLTNVGSLRLRIQSGANGAGCTFSTILQQLRRY